MSVHPCLCGDPDCLVCGDPEAAKFEDFMETVREQFNTFSTDEANFVMAILPGIVSSYRQGVTDLINEERGAIEHTLEGEEYWESAANRQALKDLANMSTAERLETLDLLRDKIKDW